jgi:hypothetical protein
MSLKAFPYKEDVLHRCWKQQAFNPVGLNTLDGLEVSVINPGVLNPSDGPDFLGAKIRIGKLIHSGAVELHIQSRDWYAHGHHQDPNYDQVILHVVVNEGMPRSTISKNGARIPGLSLRKALFSQFLEFISARKTNSLPCSGLVAWLSEGAFEQQIEKAHREYLDKKVQDFLVHYNEHKVLSEAWKNALIISLFDGLGVPYNRLAMKEVAHQLINEFEPLKLSGREVPLLVPSLLEKMNWNRKAVQPGNRPEIRLKQALQMASFIAGKPLDYFLDTGHESIWGAFMQSASMNPSPHNQRLFVAFFVPAMYALGSLVHSKNIREAAFKAWQHSSVQVPPSILKKFGIFRDSVSPKTMKRIGLVNQFKSYCQAGHCSRCQVLNKAISG